MEESNWPANRKIKPMSDATNRRQFLGITAAAGLSTGLASQAVRAEAATLSADDGKAASAGHKASSSFLTEPGAFVDVSRGNPKPFTLKGGSPLESPTDVVDLAAGYCWDGSSRVARPGRLEDGTALDLAGLMEPGKSHGVKYLKAMQCNNIAFPLGQGLWEGVPLRELINGVGEVENV